jgi:hypothetical protein
METMAVVSVVLKVANVATLIVAVKIIRSFTTWQTKNDLNVANNTKALNGNGQPGLIKDMTELKAIITTFMTLHKEST